MDTGIGFTGARFGLLFFKWIANNAKPVIASAASNGYSQNRSGTWFHQGIVITVAASRLAESTGET